MRVILFKEQFVAPIRAGTKCQTIRPYRKSNPIREGEPASLRRWTGRPYRSRQEEIVPPLVVVAARTICVTVLANTGALSVEIDGRFLPASGLDAFAVRDGFSSAAAMAEYWRPWLGREFDGVLIEWKGGGS